MKLKWSLKFIIFLVSLFKTDNYYKNIQIVNFSFKQLIHSYACIFASELLEHLEEMLSQ